MPDFEVRERQIFNVIDKLRSNAVMDSYDSESEARDSLNRYDVVSSTVYDVVQIVDQGEGEEEIRVHSHTDQAAAADDASRMKEQSDAFEAMRPEQPTQSRDVIADIADAVVSRIAAQS